MERLWRDSERVGVALRVVRESESGDESFPSRSTESDRINVAVSAYREQRSTGTICFLRRATADFHGKRHGRMFATLAGMSRRERLFTRGMALHITQRGNNRVATFRKSSDYQMFLLFLRLATTRYRVQLHAYALMPNHFHLMATPDSPEQLSRMMQSLGRRYVRFFNDRYERTGTLWEGRYRTALISTERYWLACMRYVEMNPVRGGIVASPELYRWSSYQAHACGAPDSLVASHPVYEGLGNSPETRRRAWQRICRQTVTDKQHQILRRSIRNGFVICEPSIQEYAETE